MILLLFIGINPIEQYVKAYDSGITVYYDNSAINYEKVNIYYWGSTSASWPGVEMEKVDGKENLYKYTVPTGTNGIIFNNGKVQSTDITDIEDNAKAAGATFNELSNIEGLDFTYIAGDITDNSTSEL